MNVSAQKVRIDFSEYVDEASFAKAFTITPDFDLPPKFNWKGKRVEIAFPAAFRANTTYIVTLDNNLRDLHGVAIRRPLTVAFSTGPHINKGHLAGTVLDPDDGAGVAGMDVYAYARPDSVLPNAPPENPEYRTQTDDDGTFRFEYMSGEPFFVIALRDRNRNRKPDSNEPYAVPPHRLIRADTTEKPVDLRWLVTLRDTIPPVFRQIQSRSPRRHILRFSEPVRLTRADTSGWVLRDSTTSLRRAIQAVYAPAQTPELVIILTDSLAPVPHSLHIAAVVDSSGNAAIPGVHGFTPRVATDTLHLRFVGFVPDTARASVEGIYPLRPGTLAGVRFNEPVPDARFRGIVSVADTLGNRLDYDRRTPDGITYLLDIAPPLPGVIQIDVNESRIGMADTVVTRRFHPLTQNETGELSGTVRPISTEIRVELLSAVTGRPIDPTLVSPDSAGHFIFRHLPGGGRYRFRGFIDRNGNDQWDGGTIQPYTTAEPIGWSEDLPPVRARWESVAEDTLRVK